MAQTQEDLAEARDQLETSLVPVMVALQQPGAQPAANVATLASALDEFMLVLKESFPESRIEVIQDGKRELLSIDWTKEEPVTW